jgi:hypothetical protein
LERLTQTHEDNCWQTCVAMLLGCPPAFLPDQHVLGGGLEYVHPLRAYLHEHTAMTYAEVGSERFADIARQGTPHLMMGETVRTSPEHDVWHAIVGISGVAYWDVHPSRAGLTKVFKFGFLAPIPAEWKLEWDRRKKAGDAKAFCVCPSCAVAARKVSVA